jgi:ketosteroid isomerase-like protein
VRKTLTAVIVLVTASSWLYLFDRASSNGEAAVRRAEQTWGEAIVAKSLDQTVAFYAPDAVTAGSAMFPACGLAEFRAAWAKLFADASYTFTWKTERVVVAKSGSIAYSSGTWAEGPDHGPYLAVWQKQQNGQWEVLIDAAWSVH